MSNIKLDQVRDFLQQLKSHSEGLKREGIDPNRLQRLIDALEAESHSDAPNHHTLRELLNELYAAAEVTSGKIVSSGVVSVLNHVFAIGVPTP